MSDKERSVRSSISVENMGTTSMLPCDTKGGSREMHLQSHERRPVEQLTPESSAVSGAGGWETFLFILCPSVLCGCLHKSELLLKNNNCLKTSLNPNTNLNLY